MLQLIKTNSSKWLNEQPFAPRGGFAWQAGYGAFTVSASQVPEVRKYVLTQEKHHRKMAFREEFMELLKRHDIEFDATDFEAWLE